MPRCVMKRRAHKSLAQEQRALIYVRVSTARQALEGIGLDAQESKCRTHAERMGWPVDAVFREEGISGKDGVKDRPALAALLEKAKQTPHAVIVVYSVSRLARRQRLLLELLDDLAVSSATESFDTSTPMGRAMLGMLAVFAQLEADMVSERTKDALAELKAQGKRLGAVPMAELAPETMHVVKDMYATGEWTHRTLAAELNRQGVQTASGRGKWWPKTVAAALLTTLP